jgi:hypothetical protein
MEAFLAVLILIAGNSKLRLYPCILFSTPPTLPYELASRERIIPLLFRRGLLFEDVPCLNWIRCAFDEGVIDGRAAD